MGEGEKDAVIPVSKSCLSYKTLYYHWGSQIAVLLNIYLSTAEQIMKSIVPHTAFVHYGPYSWWLTSQGFRVSAVTPVEIWSSVSPYT